MTWNESEVGGFAYVFVSPSQIWTPDVTLYNEYVSNKSHPSPVKLSWLPRPMGLFSVSCLLIGFYRATACNAMHDIALAIVSVGLSVTLVDCDKTK